jgi:NADH:ubiquinone oxidoreductase subunit D
MTFDYCYCFLGDAYDRLYIRIFELKMCLLIVKQLFFNIFFDFGFVSLFDYLYVDITIESLILLFYSIWCISIPGLTFSVVEHPKGEYLLYIILYFCSCTRLRIRCSDFLHILSLDILIRGFMLHDIVAILGNLDVVFGSIDR